MAIWFEVDTVRTEDVCPPEDVCAPPSQLYYEAGRFFVDAPAEGIDGRFYVDDPDTSRRKGGT